MQKAHATIALAGDIRNTAERTVTALEAAVLEALHGEGSVTNLRFVEDDEDKTSYAEQVKRIKETYGQTGPSNKVVSAVLSEHASVRPETFDDVSLGDRFQEGKSPKDATKTAKTASEKTEAAAKK